jgi:hypothetical protein
MTYGIICISHSHPHPRPHPQNRINVEKKKNNSCFKIKVLEIEVIGMRFLLLISANTSTDGSYQNCDIQCQEGMVFFDDHQFLEVGVVVHRYMNMISDEQFRLSGSQQNQNGLLFAKDPDRQKISIAFQMDENIVNNGEDHFVNNILSHVDKWFYHCKFLDRTFSAAL